MSDPKSAHGIDQRIASVRALATAGTLDELRTAALKLADDAEAVLTAVREADRDLLRGDGTGAVRHRMAKVVPGLIDY